MKFYSKYAFYGFCMIALAACSSGGKGSEGKKTTAADSLKGKEIKQEKARPTDRAFNDMGRFIAGLPSEEGSKMSAYEKDPTWQNYVASANNQWAGINKKFEVMTKWRDEELKATTKAGGLLFYPFSGPDFLHAAAFFPTVEEVVMIGLEPIGSLPDFEKISKKGMGGYFNGIQRGLFSILGLSFFQTNDMANDYTGRVNTDVDGTLPALMLFVERTGHKILYYEKVAIAADGKLIPATEIKVADPKKDTTYYGTRIDYQAPNSDKRRSLYYFGLNLSNDRYMGLGGLNQRSDLLNYLKSLNITSTYLKSASFLMYKPYFSIIRDLILEKAKFVLQDDSGMAFENFTKGGKWDITLFGVYAGPIPLFSNYWQNDIAQAYKQGTYPVRPLPFGIGYQYRQGSSNLMLATKK